MSKIPKSQPQTLDGRRADIRTLLQRRERTKNDGVLVGTGSNALQRPPIGHTRTNRRFQLTGEHQQRDPGRRFAGCPRAKLRDSRAHPGEFGAQHRKRCTQGRKIALNRFLLEGRPADFNSPNPFFDSRNPRDESRYFGLKITLRAFQGGTEAAFQISA